MGARIVAREFIYVVVIGFRNMYMYREKNSFLKGLDGWALCSWNFRGWCGWVIAMEEGMFLIFRMEENGIFFDEWS